MTTSNEQITTMIEGLSSPRKEICEQLRSIYYETLLTQAINRP